MEPAPPRSPPPPAPPAPPAPTFVWVAVLMGVVVLAAQAVLVFLVLDTRAEVGGVADDLRAVELRLAGGEPATPAATTTTVPPTQAAPPQTAGPTATTAASPTTLASPLDDLPSSPVPDLGSDATELPVLESNTAADPAAGTQLGELSAVEWEAGIEQTIDPADGLARAIVVFAHWCPSCQELMTRLAEWQTDFGGLLGNMELVAIASAVEEGSDPSLPEYLSDQAFPFPVLVDSDNELAARLGVSAFPFWVFVNPDGEVLGRIAGSLPAPQFQSLFADLEEIGAAEGE